MVNKPVVLLIIQHFQKCTGRVSFIVTGNFVNFIQKHKRIFYSGISKRCHNSSGHSSYIGSSMSAYFCFVSDTTQTNPDILFVQCLRYGLCHRGFTCSRRANQTDNRTFPLCMLRMKTSDCKKFKDSFLYFFHTIMVSVKNFSCIFDVIIVF